MQKAYDIIGDIHGCPQSLMALLDTLGYEKENGVHVHPGRQAIFLGDFIDRGPGQREVLEIVRPMIDSGTALAVMGNHEFNAIAYATPDPGTGDYLRPHTTKNRQQHRAFLEAFADDTEGCAETIAWFRSLPLWLDLGDLRIVHACWDEAWIRRIREAQQGAARLQPGMLKAASQPGAWPFEAIETLLKGKEIPLKPGAGFKDKDGNPGHHIRVRWWDDTATTYREAFMGPASAATHIPEDPLEVDHAVDYAHHLPACFVGHYWLEGEPEPLAANIGCVDYSVAKPGGKLVAYRWDGERVLSKDKFAWVGRVEE